MKRTLLVVFFMTFAFVAGIAYLNRFGIYDHFRQSGQHYEEMAIEDCRFHLRFAPNDPSLHRDLAHHLWSAITVTFDAPERHC